MTRLLVTLFIVKCFIINAVFATDTLYVTKPISLEQIGREYAPGCLLIDKKIFQIPYANNNGFFNSFTYPKTKFTQVYFRNSDFGVFESPGLKFLQSDNSGFYIIDSCKINLLPIFNTTGDIRIVSSQLSTLSVDNTTNLSLSLTNDSSISFIVMQNNRNMKLQLMQCSFKDSGEIRIFNSTISQFDFSYDIRSGCNIFFQNDTINNFSTSIISDADQKFSNDNGWYKHENTFTFNNCHINAPFEFFDKIPNSTFIFNNCTFGSNVYLADMAVDKIIIRNCQNIQQQFVIGFREKTSEVKLGLENSNLDNIRFDFLPNVKLVFDSIDSKDAITNSYKNLLEKFEHEGKERSYKLVDLQFRNFKDSHVFHFLNSVWWYHGYQPGLVFIWTLGLLIIFFLFNLKYWKQIFEIYPLKEGQRASVYKQDNRKLRFYSIVILYTFFIFFSLRVDLNKLNFKNLKFVYAFLAQYLIGLWCMIFIIRFIIKL